MVDRPHWGWKNPKASKYSSGESWSMA